MNTRLLRDGLEKLKVTANSEQICGIERFVHEVERWNTRMNLVKASGDALVVRHVLDCIAGIPVFRELAGRSILDVGSGAGFPGILLGIFLQSFEVTLLERSAKRVSFLQSAAAQVQLDNCRILEGELDREEGSYDIVCCRAFKPLKSSFSALTLRLKHGGSLVLYKGKKKVIDEELDSLGTKADGYQVRLLPLIVPFLQEERHLLLFRHTNQ